MQKIYWFIIDITTHKDGTQKVTFLYKAFWPTDENGKVLPYSNINYRFDTYRRMKQKHLKPIAYETKKQALETLADISIEGYLALVPSNYKEL